MAPPVPDFLALNGSPDPRPPGPLVPEAQLPQHSHMAENPGAPETQAPQERGNPQIPGNPAIPAAPVPVAQEPRPQGGPLFPEGVKVNGPSERVNPNYPELDFQEDQIQRAIALLAQANIQVALPGGATPTPTLLSDYAYPGFDPQMQTFLRVLEKSGRVTKAAELAGRSRRYFHRLRDDWPDFKRLWDQCIKFRAEMLEDEAIRRAVTGVRKEIYYKGAVCGAEQTYSDTLLTKLMEGHMPEKYRQNHKVEIDGRMAVATLVLPATTTAEEWAAQNSGTIINQEPEDEYK